MRIQAHYPFQTLTPTKGEPRMSPWIIALAVSASVLAGMTDWTAAEWTGFIGAIVGGVIAIIGAAVTAAAQVRALFRQQDKKLEETIKTAAEEARKSTITQLDATAFPTTPEQLDAFARRVATETAKQIAAKNAEPPPRVQT